jgi:class 3 adenylate cyclase
MESTAKQGTVQVSFSTFDLIKDRFSFGEQRFVECKGLGQVMAYEPKGCLSARAFPP